MKGRNLLNPVQWWRTLTEILAGKPISIYPNLMMRRWKTSVKTESEWNLRDVCLGKIECTEFCNHIPNERYVFGVPLHWGSRESQLESSWKSVILNSVANEISSKLPLTLNVFILARKFILYLQKRKKWQAG